MFKCVSFLWILCVVFTIVFIMLKRCWFVYDVNSYYSYNNVYSVNIYFFFQGDRKYTFSAEYWIGNFWNRLNYRVVVEREVNDHLWCALS